MSSGLTQEEVLARQEKRYAEDEVYVLERLRREADIARQFPRSHEHEGMHLWQLGYGRPEIELALYRLRKKGTVLYDKRTRRWRLR